MSDEAAFRADPLDIDVACAGGFEAGVAAVDITPAELVDGVWRFHMEPFEDVNGNGVYDVADPTDPPAPETPEEGFDAALSLSEPFVDENANGKWDGPFMAGYGHEKRGNEYYVAGSVHDPVWARAVALRCGDATVGLVSVDTVGLFRGFVLDIRETARTTGAIVEDPCLCDYDHIVVASTHTHDSVDTMGLWGPSTILDGKDPAIMELYREGVLDALTGALFALEPVADVKLAMGRTGDLDAGVIGTVQTDIRDPFVVDDRVAALQLLRSDGSTIATVVNWSPHPETMAGTRSEVSSDYPDKLRRAIETEGATVGGTTLDPLGGTAVFFSGAVGGMMTTLGARPRDETGTVVPDYTYAKADRIGEIAAWTALDALARATATPPTGLAADARLSTVPADNPFLFALNTIGVLDHEVAIGPVLVPGVGPQRLVPPVPFLRVETNVLTVRGAGGALLQMLTIPGELLPEVALGNPLDHGAEASAGACFAFLPEKLAQNAGRANGKPDPSRTGPDGRLDGVKYAGFARVLAANPAYPKEPALVDLAAEGATVMLLGLANDELGYMVPLDDYVLAGVFPEPASDGVDRCGDDDHYEETNSGSSLLAWAASNDLASMLDAGHVPASLPQGTAGFVSGSGETTPVPGWDTRGIWLDTSRSGGHETQEDARVVVQLPEGLPGCWGFLDGLAQDQGGEPTEDTRGLWIDIDGGCTYGPGDAYAYADMWAASEGQPRWRP